jgi:hypothetical protein
MSEAAHRKGAESSSRPRAESARDAAKVPVWTWRDAIRKAKVPPLTKHVCNMIANYVSNVGEGAYPSVKTLMVDTGMSNRSVATHLAKAEAAGLLKIERTEAGADGRFKRSTYFPRFPNEAVLSHEAGGIATCVNNDPNLDEDPREGDDHMKEAHADRPSDEASPGPLGDRVNLVHEPREPSAKNRVKEVHANSPVEPSREPSTRTPSAKADKSEAGVRANFGNLGAELWKSAKPSEREVLELFVGPLWVAKQRPKGIAIPAAFLADQVEGIAAKNFDAAILKRAYALAREGRTVMPSLPEALKLCEQAKREIEGGAAASAGSKWKPSDMD